jgi:hypothetical protein
VNLRGFTRNDARSLGVRELPVFFVL